MFVTKTSIISGVEHTREIDITLAQLHRWMAGENLHVVAPHLDSDDREYIISGSTPDEWAELFA